MLSIFAVSMATLEHMNSSRKSKSNLNNTIALPNDGDFLVIVALASLAKIDTTNAIPKPQWAKVFSFINEHLLPSTQKIFSNGNQMMDLIIQTLNLITNLIDRHSAIDELSSWIFTTSLNIVKLLFPSVFAEVPLDNALFKYGNILRSNYVKSELSLFET
jgi:hypothetical protein